MEIGEEVVDSEYKIVKQEIVDEEEYSCKSERKKRKLKAMADDGCEARLQKRILLSLSKPSYVLGLGATHLRSENSSKLYKLLQKLVRQHNWTEAAGVLSVLLQGTCKDQSPRANRLKFSTSLGLLRHIQGDRAVKIISQGDRGVKARIQQIYDIWMKRVRYKNDELVEDGLAVHLEYIIAHLTLGYVDEAYQGSFSSLKQRKEFWSHPMAHLVIGLTYYHRWYSSIPTEMQCEDVDQSYFQPSSDISGERLQNDDGYLEWHDSVYSENADTHSQFDSVVSVKNDQVLSMEIDSNIQTETPMEIEVNLKRGNSLEDIQPSFCEDSQASFDRDSGQVGSTKRASNFSVLVKKGLDPWLFPLRLPHSIENSEDLFHLHGDLINDDYRDAVKYLQLALSSQPLALVALLPLTQLLLVGGQVDEALNALEKFGSTSNAALPMRPRARIMECYDRNNHALLSSCYEDNLKKDATCFHSLAKLIIMHQTGNYDTASLLEMIAKHLECAYPEHTTWREFAICFLRFSQSEEDRLSICLNETEDEVKERYPVRYNRIPDIFTTRDSKKSWSVRCRWWKTRHFSKKMLKSETAAGDLQLLACKAACASHMYGQKFLYVAEAHECLQRENSLDLLKFLQTHMEYSIDLYSSFQQRTKL